MVEWVLDLVLKPSVLFYLLNVFVRVEKILGWDLHITRFGSLNYNMRLAIFLKRMSTLLGYVLADLN